eukprot:TRINITY_DN7034_c0_g2_i1.p1 TRINITY_DN7034_c0_g2~~TRINITY_DN7034_c0_g2_i1.p1  ORF type:complete len:172 (+),score=83.91 TRINITY_DN7034_c0_g2_i1:410-925(+)
MQTLRIIPQPIIAQIDGIATAAGCQLTASCDLAIASTRSLFATPGVKIGLFCTTPGVAISRTISTKRTFEMLFTGENISAQIALEYGLVNKIFDSQVLEQETLKLANQIAQTPLPLLSLGKQAFYEQIEKGANLFEAYDISNFTMSSNLSNEFANEGIKAFLEKKQPSWKL